MLVFQIDIHGYWQELTDKDELQLLTLNKMGERWRKEQKLGKDLPKYCDGGL